MQSPVPTDLEIPGPQLGRRRRFTTDEKRRFLDEASRPGETVSSVGRRYGLSVSLLFRWRRQLQNETARRTKLVGPKPVVRRDEELRKLREQVKELQRLLGKKTLENELLRESMRQLGAPEPAAAEVAKTAPNVAPAVAQRPPALQAGRPDGSA